MDVEDVLLPVRLPSAKFDEKLWRVVMTTAVELAESSTIQLFCLRGPIYQRRGRLTMIPRVPQPGTSTPYPVAIVPLRALCWKTDRVAHQAPSGLAPVLSRSDAKVLANSSSVGGIKVWPVVSAISQCSTSTIMRFSFDRSRWPPSSTKGTVGRPRRSLVTSGENNNSAASILAIAVTRLCYGSFGDSRAWQFCLETQCCYQTLPSYRHNCGGRCDVARK